MLGNTINVGDYLAYSKSKDGLILIRVTKISNGRIYYKFIDYTWHGFPISKTSFTSSARKAVVVNPSIELRKVFEADKWDKVQTMFLGDFVKNYKNPNWSSIK